MKEMLRFTDLHLTKHVVNLYNINNVVINTVSDGSTRFSFHFSGHHALMVQVDKETAKRIEAILTDAQPCTGEKP